MPGTEGVPGPLVGAISATKPVAEFRSWGMSHVPSKFPYTGSHPTRTESKFDQTWEQLSQSLVGWTSSWPVSPG